MHLRMLAVDAGAKPDGPGMPPLSRETICDYLLLGGGLLTCIVTTTLTIRNHH